MENVRPVEPLGGIAVLVEDDQVRREAGFVENPASHLSRGVDVISLRNSGGYRVELGP
jgi:hypothetical protein